MNASNGNGPKHTGTSSSLGTGEAQGQDGFKARRMLKSELAMLYHVSMDGLRKRMKRTSGLMEELEACGYNKRQYDFTKEQVGVIVGHLGEPYH